MGLFSRAPRFEAQIGFFGIEGQLATERCLYTAAVRGVELEIEYVTDSLDIEQTADYQFLSPFERVPSLNHNHFSIVGARGIIAYIDALGSGTPLAPVKAQLLGLQNYWIELTTKILAPVLQDTEVQKMPCVASTALVDHPNAYQLVNKLNQIVTDEEFILGVPSLADPQICAYIKPLYRRGQLPPSMRAIPHWYNRVRNLIPDTLRANYESVFTLSKAS